MNALILRCGTYLREELIEKCHIFRSECNTARRLLEGLVVQCLLEENTDIKKYQIESIIGMIKLHY